MSRESNRHEGCASALQYLEQQQERFVRDLAELVAIPSISTDGAHAQEIETCAHVTAEQMRRAGLEHVEVLHAPGAYPYVYGDWLHADGQPTVLLYSHYDVQPTNYLEQWHSDPWTLTERDGRLYGRGAADDKGAISVQLASLEAWLKTVGRLPVNVKMLVEGEEEVGSRNLLGFLRHHRERLQADVLVVTDTENLDTQTPCITTSLRGIITLKVEVRALERPLHSGMAGGLAPDAALALNAVLARLCWAGKRRIPVPGFYEGVKRMSGKERKALRALKVAPQKLRKDLTLLPGVKFANLAGVHPYEQTWRLPAVTVIAQEASSLKQASNQVLPYATALVSVRIVPEQEPKKVIRALTKELCSRAPWGVQVQVTPVGEPVKWWYIQPKGAAFDAALRALQAGYGRKPLAIGCGGTIGFVGPLCEMFGGIPALLLGIEDPQSAAHSPNESLSLDIFRNLARSLVFLFAELAQQKLQT
ncbi:MAG: M20/M25/M40 family metallo-hydrolase [Gemmatales bacterium]|nr:M20/M25/M40 family metallo-hydrolase [Gemmatales bacterium]MDW8221681.1 M20/M25/M40 family metallo-hydrolase [Gemmatales bacterium]